MDGGLTDSRREHSNRLRYHPLLRLDGGWDPRVRTRKALSQEGGRRSSARPDLGDPGCQVITVLYTPRS